ncbi:hypothetical protein ACQ4M3_15555 [Leptolyngbya sp. AN03gr2]|uniref:hypothetical protein n=1 Tax=unclassified Leptolyngbya TaxID=2650499 RepID=UPI003D31473E
MKTAVVFVSLLLYGISLANPVFYFVDTKIPISEPDIYSGILVLFIGWLGALMLQFGWYANIPYLMSLVFVLMRKQESAIVYSAAALFIGITNTIWLFYQRIPGGAGNTDMRLQHLERGYYFWITALIIPFVWSAFRYLYSKPR